MALYCTFINPETAKSCMSLACVEYTAEIEIGGATTIVSIHRCQWHLPPEYPLPSRALSERKISVEEARGE